MTVERKKVNEACFNDIKEQFDSTLKELPSYVDAAMKTPKNLSLLIGRAEAAVAYGCVVEPESPQIPQALRLAADGHTALFAATFFPEESIEVRLGDYGTVRYTSPPDQSTVHVGRWIAGFYFNVLCGGLDSVGLLCRVPTEVLRRSTTKAPEYQYLYMEALKAFGEGKTDSIVKTILAAVKATDPQRPDIFDADWTLYLDVPQLEVLIYVVTKDQKLSVALLKALELHKKYWSKTEERRRDYQGFISIELTALSALGQRQGLTLDAQSPYLPMHLAKI